MNELTAILIMVLVPVGIVVTTIFVVTVLFMGPKCADCGKPIRPFTASSMCPSRHRRCQERFLRELMDDPANTAFVMREVREWKAITGGKV